MQTLPDFDYHAPESVPEALALQAEFGESCALYAGGTELLLAMRHRLLRVEHLIDLKSIQPLYDISVLPDRVLRIGATATHAEILDSALVRAVHPWIAMVTEHIGNVRVRASGTLGGNLCFAEPHSDPATLLVVLGALVRCADQTSDRSIPVADFLEGPFRTQLRPGEILTGVDIPPPKAGLRVGYAKFQITERPLVNVAVALSIDGGAVVDGRAALGCLGGRPVSSCEVDAMLPGPVETLPQRAFIAGERLAEDASPLDDHEGGADYKRQCARVLFRRAVEAALRRSDTIVLVR